NSTSITGWVAQGTSRVVTEQGQVMERFQETVQESLAWMVLELYSGSKDDLLRAVRCVLLLRYFFRDNIRSSIGDLALHRVYSAINNAIGDKSYLFAGVDGLNKEIDRILQGLSSSC